MRHTRHFCFFMIVAIIAASRAAWGAADVPQLVEGNTEFALDLYSKLKTQPGNVFFSPYSVSAALAMTYGGAKSQTADQIQKTLHFNAGQQVHDAFKALNGRLDDVQKGGKIQLRMANSIWPQKGFEFLPDYVLMLGNNYGVKSESLDFKRKPEKAVKAINDWVREQTEGKIQDLISSDALNDFTRLVLVNAIYFKGSWDEEFDRADTWDDDFTKVGGQKIRVPLMNNTETFKYARLDGAQIIEMPYKGDQLSMVIVLPSDAAGISKLEDRLNSVTLQSWVGKTGRCKVVLTVPKFKITYGTIDMGEMLASMGMTLALSNIADFSGMTGSRDLKISKVMHKAFIEVNEQGTEAAAATAVAMAAMSAPIGPPEEPVRFKADHPFLFLIRDKATGSILFMGRVMDPSKE